MSEGEDSGCVQCSAVDNGWFGKCSRHSEGTHLHVLEQRVEYVRDSLPSTLTTLKLTLPLALTASLGVREAKRERDRRRRKQPDSNGCQRQPKPESGTFRPYGRLQPQSFVLLALGE